MRVGCARERRYAYEAKATTLELALVFSYAPELSRVSLIMRRTILKGTVRRATKMFNQFQLVLQHCCETSSKAVLRCVLPPTNHQTCLATNHVVAGCANLLQEVKRVVLLFTTKFVHVARFTGLLQTFLAASDVTPVWRDSRVILSNQRSVHAQLATTRFVVKTVRFETGWQTRLQQCCKTS